MRFLFLTGLFFITLVSCKDEDDRIAFREYDFEIEDFIWEALNTYYYWQDGSPIWLIIVLTHKNHMHHFCPSQ